VFTVFPRPNSAYISLEYRVELPADAPLYLFAKLVVRLGLDNLFVRNLSRDVRTLIVEIRKRLE